MFITLRTTSGRQNAAGEMEQVARRSAGPGGVVTRRRQIRHPACVACQTKKLRCTGSPRNCDRCQARLIECVVPTSGGRGNRTPLSKSASPSSTEWQRHNDASPQPTNPSVDSPSGDSDGLNSSSGSTLDSSITTSLDPLDNDLFNHDFAPLDPPGMTWATDIEVSSVPTPPNPDQTSSPPCSCLNDLVRVVQQLDDDEFHITTLSLDQVLQLQKWLIFQYCKSLDCPSCPDPSANHSVRLIICDRLTEMFECIHKRIKRAGAILTGQSSDPSIQSASSLSSLSQSSNSQSPGPHPVPQPPDAAVGTGPLPAQLFCGTSGRAANTAACNPKMFSDQFRSQYTDEEQVHMIRALLRLQVRNFHKLLLRVEGTSPVAASQARLSKVKSLMVRLGKASADIEGALGVVFRAFSAG